MVAAHETVFSVLGGAARRRAVWSLVVQLTISVAVAVTFLAVAPQWWSLACLAGWSAAYSAWGLFAHDAESRTTQPPSLRALMVATASLGAALAVAGLIGVGLAFYTGTAGGAKTTCGKHSTSKYCQAWAHPQPATRPIP
jgi:hypothetical protein